MLVFEERGKPEYPEKTSRSKERTNNKLNPHMTPGRTRATLVGGASALATAPPLLPCVPRLTASRISTKNKHLKPFDTKKEENFKIKSPHYQIVCKGITSLLFSLVNFHQITRVHISYHWLYDKLKLQI